MQFISMQVDEDIDSCEIKYRQIFEKLGTTEVEEVQRRIENEVIPYDIQKQSLENDMRDKLQELGLL